MKDVLAHETRRGVYELVRRQPGMHLRDIARSLDLSITLTDYHLRFLAKHDLVSFQMEGEYKRFYPRYHPGDPEAKAALDESDKKVLAFLRQRVPRAVILRLLETESGRHRDLSDATDVSPSTLSHHLRRLVQAGILFQAPGRVYQLVNPRRAARLTATYEIATEDQVETFLRVWGEFRV